MRHHTINAVKSNLIYHPHGYFFVVEKLLLDPGGHKDCFEQEVFFVGVDIEMV